jgi:PAS domain-containing protein/ActR/RegA family two-component response regulator
MDEMSKSLRILLIADDPEVIRKIGQGLQRQDSGLIMIEGADSLATARRRLGAGVYDLALVDLSLGQGDALHLLSDLRGIAPELAIVALAADGAGPDVAACLAVGAQDRLAPEAMDSAGLMDRLRSAKVRAEAGLDTQRRSQRIAGSLGAAGDLAWHWEPAESEVWLAAADPERWQLPGPECRESLEAVRERVHPDDRERAVRRIEEVLLNDSPWQLEARVKVGGGAYRWCELRGCSQLDERGRLIRASGVLSDAQREQKRLREIEQGRRLLRAVFDSDRSPRAVLNSAAVITDCNQAWLAFEDPACHAGKRFRPGVRFIDEPDGVKVTGDLDTAELARGVRKVLGGVVEQFQCEYGLGERRWRIGVSPLLNPGIAGAVIIHEEVTEAARAERALQAGIEVVERDLRALSGPVFRIAADFKVSAANEEAMALGRAPVIDRDVLRVLAREHAKAVGDALAALADGAQAAVRDAQLADGGVMRWLLSVRRDAAGGKDGFLAHGVAVSDLAAAVVPEPVVEQVDHEAMAEIQSALVQVEQQRDVLQRELKDALGRLEVVQQVQRDSEDQEPSLREEMEQQRKLLAEAREALSAVEREREELRAGLEEQRRLAEEAKGAGEAADEQRQRLAAELDAERLELNRAQAALASAAQIPATLRAGLAQARERFEADLGELVDKACRPLASAPEEGPPAPATPRKSKSKAV